MKEIEVQLKSLKSDSREMTGESSLSLLELLYKFSKLYNNSLEGLEEKIRVVADRLQNNSHSSLSIKDDNSIEDGGEKAEGLVVEYRDLFKKYSNKILSLHDSLDTILTLL